MTNQVDWKGIRGFLLLNFVPTWTIWIGMLIVGVRFDNLTTMGTLIVAGTMWLPGLAALITRRFVSREGFADAGFRFGSWRPYIGLLLAVPVLFGLTYVLSLLAGVAQFDLSLTGFLDQLRALAGDEAVEELVALGAAPLIGLTLVSTLTYAPVVTALATAGEELGWTGYLLPKLMPLGKWRAVLTYGFIWGLWHAPIIYGGHNYSGYPVLGIFMMILLCMALALSHGALRIRYGSVWLTTWWHALINTQNKGIWVMMFVGVNPVLGGMTGVTGVLVIGAFGYWLMRRAPETLQDANLAQRSV